MVHGENVGIVRILDFGFWIGCRMMQLFYCWFSEGNSYLMGCE